MTKIYFQKLHPELCDFIKKPTPSIFETPTWWKDASKYTEDAKNYFPTRHNSTARSCPAINDAFNFGYTLFFPIDVYIDSTNKNQIEWEIPIEVKKMEVFQDIPDTFISFMAGEKSDVYKRGDEFHRVVGKINPLWAIKTQSGYSVWITHPIGRTDLPFKMIDAVMDTDKFPAVFPYSFFIKNNFKGVIKAGTPLMQVIPFKRENFVSEIIEKDDKEINKSLTALDSIFTNAYKKIFWVRKKFL